MKMRLIKEYRRLKNVSGSVDILVNNAGIIKRIPILEMEIADYKQVIDVDLVAPLIVSKTCRSKND
jgi:gluconate 5-dehydrogenase